MTAGRDSDKPRRALRLHAAEAFMRGATQADVLADVLAAHRGAGSPGGRELGDAGDLAFLWNEIDHYASQAGPESSGAPPG